MAYYVRVPRLTQGAEIQIAKEKEDLKKRKRDPAGEVPNQPAEPSQPDEKKPRVANVWDGLPEGWLTCPPLGKRFDAFFPCKVPLGTKYDEKIPEQQRFTPFLAVRRICQEAKGKEIGLVIDLTNTTRYYSQLEFTSLGIQYIKIACGGRDGPPEPSAVNEFCFEVKKFLAQRQQKFILVHCTHGHNRTSVTLLQLVQDDGQVALLALLVAGRAAVLIFTVDAGVLLIFTVDAGVQALEEFAKIRPPGIYKESYVSSLFAYYHTERPSTLLRAPGTPEWKSGKEAEVEVPEDDLFGKSNLEYQATPAESPVEPPKVPLQRGYVRWKGRMSGGLVIGLHVEEEEEEGDEARGKYGEGAVGTEDNMSHEDVIGEAVPEEQAFELRKVITFLLLGHENFKTFMGSQADGTRYMLLIMGLADGVFLIDRKFNIRRVQMKFPCRSDLKKQHMMTLCDGEMVVDVDAMGVATRRYLIYDVMAINGRSEVKALPFAVATKGKPDRFTLIAHEIIGPRTEMQ
eukprot:gene1250-1828_t